MNIQTFPRFILQSIIVLVAFGAFGQIGFAQDPLPTWYNTDNERGFPPNIPDFYQHQKLKPNHATNPPQPPPGQNDVDWEPDGGWCYIATYVNAMYRLYREGSCKMFGPVDPNITNDNWLGIINDYIKNMETNLGGGPNGMQKWLDDHDDAAPTPTCKRPLKYDLFVRFPDAIRQIGTIPNPAAAGFYFLTATEWKKVKGGITPYDKIEQVLLDNATTTIRVRTLPWGPLEVQDSKWVDPKFSKALWWSGNGGNTDVIASQPGYTNKTFQPCGGCYHAVIVAGIDALNHKIFISDPDSNKGNFIANAGFRTTTAIVNAVQGRKYHPWVAAMGGGDAIPVPTRGTTPDADPLFISPYYMGLTVDADGFTFTGADAANERYRNVVITWVETFATPAVRKKIVPALTPTVEHRYDVSTGNIAPTDEIWFLPNLDFGILPDTVLLSGAIAGWDAEFVGSPGPDLIDPYDNSIIYTGLKLSRGADPPLMPGEVGELKFETAFPQDADKYVVYSRDANHPLDYRVQAYGLLEPEQIVQSDNDYAAESCACDVDGDGVVDKRDLVIIIRGGASSELIINTLNHWGPCK